MSCLFSFFSSEKLFPLQEEEQRVILRKIRNPISVLSTDPRHSPLRNISKSIYFYWHSISRNEFINRIIPFIGRKMLY
jgi:hypothetical protein